MPRLSAASSDETLQGSLFAEPEPVASAASPDPISDPGELSDDELGADAAARPRQRSQQETQSSDQPSTTEDKSDNEVDTDEPAWTPVGRPLRPRCTSWSSRHPPNGCCRQGTSSSALKTRSRCPVAGAHPYRQRRRRAIGRVPMAAFPTRRAVLQ